MSANTDPAAGPADRFLSALCLASRLPLGVRFRYDQSRLDFHLPLVGALVAAAPALALPACAALGLGPFYAALLLLALQYLGFNLFHLDGLMDSADAFLGNADREKRQAILKDSRIGVYGFFGGFLALALKLALFASLAGRWSALSGAGAAALLAYPVAGRAAAALVPAFAPPARSDGLGAQAAGARIGRVALGSATALALMSGAALLGAFLFRGASMEDYGARDFAPLLAFFPAAFAGAAFMAAVYRRGLGGYTGDAQGAAVELGEAAYLAAALAVSARIG